jgi:DnaJ-class molecular chaperone
MTSDRHDGYGNVYLFTGSEACRRCDGTGNELARYFRRCQHCGGTGKRAPVASDE